MLLLPIKSWVIASENSNSRHQRNTKMHTAIIYKYVKLREIQILWHCFFLLTYSLLTTLTSAHLINSYITFSCVMQTTSKTQYFLCSQVLHRLRSVSKLVPWSLCGDPAERGQPHRWIRVSAVSVDRGRYDGLHSAHWQGLRGPSENPAFLTGKH